MSIITIEAKLQDCYQTAELWSVLNPVLLAGQVGRESDTGRSKTGDGSTPWCNLGYNKASSLAIPRKIGLSGVSSVPQDFDGSKDINIPIIGAPVFVMGTQTAATGAWTGVAGTLDTLRDGQVIFYWLPVAGSGSATLNLTLANGAQTGDIECYYSGTTRLTTHYAAGNVVVLMYRQDGVISGKTYTGWWAHGQYDTNVTYQQRYYGNIKAETAIVAKNIIVGTNAGYKHLSLGTAFDITLPILYAGSAIKAAATGTNNFVGHYFDISTTQAGTWTPYAPIYLKGALSGTTFTPASTAPLTQTVPTSSDNYEYYLLGYCYTATNMQLCVEHSVFKFVDGLFQMYTPSAAYAQYADKATKLATARTLKIGNTGKTFDGSANVTWTLAEIGAGSGGGEVEFTEYTALDGGQGILQVDLTNSHAWIKMQYDFDGKYKVNITAIPTGKAREIVFFSRNPWTATVTSPTGIDYYGDSITSLSASAPNLAVRYELIRSSNIVTIAKTSQYVICLTGDTLVTMADFTEKRLDKIEIGDTILSYNWETLKLVSNKVIYTDKGAGKKWHVYDKWTFEDGTVIKTVHRHEFYCVENKGMKYMDEWTFGEHAHKIDGSNPALVSHEVVSETVNHYKITGECGTNYFANGLLTGDRNCAKNIAL